MAGTGKMTIAFSVCAELDARNQLGASFFCSRLREECKKVNITIPSIAYQLAQFSRPFWSALSAVLEKDPNVHGRLSHMQFDALIAKPILEVQHTLPEALVAVIDALDECEQKESTGSVLDVLLSKSVGLPIKFLVSSRPEAEIRDQMADDRAKSRLVLYELNKGKVEADIEKYLRQGLSQMSPSDTQITELVERAGILFIYAAMAVRYIGFDSFQSDPHDRLRTILKGSSSPEDKESEEIDQLYMTVLEAALGNPRLRKVERDNMRQILHTVICARDSLTVPGLSELLQINIADRVRSALRPLWSVLHVVGSSGLVTTLHTSFPDFMLNSARSKAYCCHSHSHNRILAERCLELIEQTRPQFNIRQLESSYIPDEMVPNIEERTNQAISLGLLYSCRYWADHVKAGAHGSSVAKLLQEFLSTRLLLWMEVLNLRKRMKAGVECMKQIEEWCNQYEGNHELVELAQDVQRFADAFASNPISLSTSHIYVSMLPFWPKSAPITRCYAAFIHAPVKVEGTALDRRQQILLATWAYEGPIKTIAVSPNGQSVALRSGDDVLVADSATIIG
ncbi:hypothetical protein B0J17DRAFT_267152 [Rhizoctonia solani]|nr:hypothetical protein B0J17DRAFT_267152 [Rhizoctonia solani]